MICPNCDGVGRHLYRLPDSHLIGMITCECREPTHGRLDTRQTDPLHEVKVCPCCQTRYTLAEWRQLKDVGLGEDYDPYPLRFRDCPCGSTLAISDWQDMGDERRRRHDRMRVARARRESCVVFGDLVEFERAQWWVLAWGQAEVASR